MAGPSVERNKTAPPLSPISAVLASSRATFVSVGLISGVINVLMLTGAIFMMQVYDRVLTSHSIPTLAVLAALATGAYVFQGALDILRGRILMLIGERIDDEIGPRVNRAVIALPLNLPRGSNEALQPFRDLEGIRAYLSGSGPGALFDVPWVPLYLVIVYLIHPMLGFAAGIGALVLGLLTVVANVISRSPTLGAAEALSTRNALSDAAQHSAEAVRSMGMMPGLRARWDEAHSGYLKAQRRAGFRVGGLSSTSRMLRMILQSAVLELGAYLAINGQISAGAIIAASILASRALAPVDQVIATWKAFVGARAGYARVKRLLTLFPDEVKRFKLPPPSNVLRVEGLTICPPGSSTRVVRRVSMRLRAGQALGIIGPSASGKSSLARALVGIWQPQMGKVTLDGAAIDQWTPEDLGPAIGFLPQDVQLLGGTVSDNIARFSAEADPSTVIAAAQAAGLHEHILALPRGYETIVGEGGAHLSAGQRQRLGLARALYGDPFLVVLDEPNSNLDADGEAAVNKAILAVRARGGIAIVIAHRPSVVSAVDTILMLDDGDVVALGPKDEILRKTVRNSDAIITQSGQPTDTLSGLRSVNNSTVGA